MRICWRQDGTGVGREELVELERLIAVEQRWGGVGGGNVRDPCRQRWGVFNGYRQSSSDVAGICTNVQHAWELSLDVLENGQLEEV